MTCMVQVSFGELFDKVSILEIKKDKITDQKSNDYIVIELNDFYKNNTILKDSKYTGLFQELKITNLKLWEIEDNIRKKENSKEFDNEFIELARSVYYTNDKRSTIKKEINILSNSTFREIKMYQTY